MYMKKKEEIKRERRKVLYLAERIEKSVEKEYAEGGWGFRDFN